MIRITGQIRSTDSIQLDGNYGPYETRHEAHEYLSGLMPALNKVGVTVGIKDNITQTVEEYWYQGGTAEQDLVKKQSDGISSDMSFDQKLQAQANLNDTDADAQTGKIGYKVLQPETEDPTTSFAAQIAGLTNTIFEIKEDYNLDINNITINEDVTVSDVINFNDYWYYYDSNTTVNVSPSNSPTKKLILIKNNNVEQCLLSSEKDSVIVQNTEITEDGIMYPSIRESDSASYKIGSQSQVSIHLTEIVEIDGYSYFKSNDTINLTEGDKITAKGCFIVDSYNDTILSSTGEYTASGNITVYVARKKTTFVQYSFLVMPLYEIPSNSTLKFNGGIIKNGAIKFNNTTLSGIITFDSSIRFADGSTVANAELRTSWFKGEDKTDGLQSLFDLQTTVGSTKNIFIDESELIISHPIIVNQGAQKGKMVIKGLGINCTRITPSNSWSATGYDYNAFFIIKGMWNNRGGFEDMMLDGKLVVGYGMFFPNYMGWVENCDFEYFYTAALVTCGTENGFIQKCRFFRCGCAIVANAKGIYDENNLLNWSYTGYEGGGTISQMKIDDNYIVYCNYGILMAQADCGCRIKGNAFGYTSCYALVVNATRNIDIYENYEEGCGCSYFWIHQGQTVAQLTAEVAAKVMPSHLANPHEDIGGLTMSGWGYPHGDDKTSGTIADGADKYIRPKFLLRGSNVVLKNNFFSMNHVRTKLSDSGLSTNDTALGVDTVITISNIQTFVFENNSYQITNGEISKYGITKSSWLFGQAPTSQTGSIGVSTQSMYLYSIKDIYVERFGNQWIYEPYRLSIGYSKLPAGINSLRRNLYDKHQNINIANKSGKYAYNLAMNVGNRATYMNKNIYELSGGNVVTIDNIPFFKINEQFSTLWKGTSFILEKSLLKQNSEIVLGVHNANSDNQETPNTDEGERTVLFEIYCYSESATAVKKTSSTIKLASGETAYIKSTLPLEEIDTDYVGISIRNSEQESDTALGDVYMTVPYIQGCQDRISYEIVSEISDEFGRLIKGTTDHRPVNLGADSKGFRYFDETLGKNIVWNGTAWVNEDGSDLDTGTIISVGTIEGQSDMPTMSPNRQYNYGTFGGNLTEDASFALGSALSGETSIFYWTFTTASSLTYNIGWPTGITWADGNAPTIDPSTYYEVMVCNGVATCIKI